MKGWFFRLSRHPKHTHAIERRTSLRAIKTSLWPSLTGPVVFLQSLMQSKLSAAVGRYEGTKRSLSHSRPSYEKFFSYDGRSDSRSRARLSRYRHASSSTHTHASRYKHLHVSPPASGSGNITFSLFIMHVNSCVSSCLYETRGRMQWIKMSRDARIEWFRPCGRFVPHRRNSASLPDMFLASHSRVAAGCDARASN